MGRVNWSYYVYVQCIIYTVFLLTVVFYVWCLYISVDVYLNNLKHGLNERLYQRFLGNALFVVMFVSIC